MKLFFATGYDREFEGPRDGDRKCGRDGHTVAAESCAMRQRVAKSSGVLVSRVMKQSARRGFFSCWEGNFCGRDPKLAEMQYGDIVQCHWSLDY
jgi:hypothetical protein